MQDVQAALAAQSPQDEREVPKLFSADIEGIYANLVHVEADLHVGLYSFHVVGLADKAVSEAKERVNAALKHCGAKPPSKENRAITVNLAPADVRKSGSRFDVPIALAYLLASRQIAPFAAEDKMFLGELSLDGAVRPIHGALSAALLARARGVSQLFVPRENAAEAAAIHEVQVVPFGHLRELVDHLEGRAPITPQPASHYTTDDAPPYAVRLSDIRGHAAAKRALAVAAAGAHHVLFSGPPGTGKTMLAQAFASLFPPPDMQERIQITQIYSSAGLMAQPFIGYRPLRAPHHTASVAALLGGGGDPKPGEASLAHRGVLFLDELPEFRRDALEGLRQPLESGEVHVARAKKTLVFPARFTLVAAMNPCPCGYFGDETRECRCTAHEVVRYQKKVSGPLLDRIDLQLHVPRIPAEELMGAAGTDGEDAQARALVAEARERQARRFAALGLPYHTNAEMRSKDVDRHVALDGTAEGMLRTMLQKMLISPRGYYRILKIAQTIADIEGAQIVSGTHLGEAFQYRVKEGASL